MPKVNTSRVRFTPIDAFMFNVAAGAAGWVDTDVSGTTGTNTQRIWLIEVYGVTTTDSYGARPHGSALAPLGYGRDFSMLSKVDTTGHMDLYRVAGGDAQYRFLGYLE